MTFVGLAMAEQFINWSWKITRYLVEMVAFPCFPNRRVIFQIFNGWVDLFENG